MCGKEEWVANKCGRVTQPSQCSNAACQMPSMMLHLQKSGYIDLQEMEVQANPSNVPEGQTPCTLRAILRKVC